MKSLLLFGYCALLHHAGTRDTRIILMSIRQSNPYVYTSIIYIPTKDQALSVDSRQHISQIRNVVFILTTSIQNKITNRIRKLLIEKNITRIFESVGSDSKSIKYFKYELI